MGDMFKQARGGCDARDKRPNLQMFYDSISPGCIKTRSNTCQAKRRDGLPPSGAVWWFLHPCWDMSCMQCTHLWWKQTEISLQRERMSLAAPRQLESTEYLPGLESRVFRFFSFFTFICFATSPGRNRDISRGNDYRGWAPQCDYEPQHLLEIISKYCCLCTDYTPDVIRNAYRLASCLRCGWCVASAAESLQRRGWSLPGWQTACRFRDTRLN